MAKRGYRGPHPYNDTKVSPKNPSSNKYSSKLTTEYNKLNSNKKKYDYIRTHYFYPVGVGTITISGNVGDGETITVISTDGTSVAYTGAGSENLAANPPEFKRNGGDNGVIATSIKDCINTGHSGKILASVDGAVVTLTQLEPGPDGNTTITEADGSVAVTNFTGG